MLCRYSLLAIRYSPFWYDPFTTKKKREAARDESLHVSSHALRLSGHGLYRQISRRLGRAAQHVFRSKEGTRALQPLSRRARACRRARFRRRLGQRAPPERLWADALAGGDGRRTLAPDQERQDRDPRQRLLPA